MKANWQQDMPSSEAYWMGKVLFEIHHIATDFERFMQDKMAYLEKYPLSEEHKRAICEDDIGGMYLAGVNPYLLRAHCIALRIPESESVASLAAVAERTRNG